MSNQLTHSEFVQRFKTIVGEDHWRYKFLTEYAGMYRTVRVQHQCGEIRENTAAMILKSPLCRCLKKDRMVAPHTPRKYTCEVCRMEFYKTPMQYRSQGCSCCRSSKTYLYLDFVRQNEAGNVVCIVRTSISKHILPVKDALYSGRLHCRSCPMVTAATVSYIKYKYRPIQITNPTSPLRSVDGTKVLCEDGFVETMFQNILTKFNELKLIAITEQEKLQ